MKLPGKLSKEIVLLVFGTVLAGFYIIKKLGWFIVKQSNVNIDRIGSDILPSDGNAITMIAFATKQAIDLGGVHAPSFLCTVQVQGGLPPLSYLWQFDSFAGSRATIVSPNLATTEIWENDNGAKIHCVVSDSEGKSAQSNSV